ncbi:hypothetical protein [Bythopirellula goksoeyrii]|uniref:hypothetical protein n=1 Tax=Bythopirellula goksoeyrii TaxID=1400387 RepID=UPI0011CDDFA6|nr:hypothetical protein [Bythopirellula goksoeyrii]
MTETLGLELAEIKANMVPGQKWEDFSFATLEDVSNLAASAEVDWIEPWSFPTNYGTEAEELVKLIGKIYDLSHIIVDIELSYGQIVKSLGNDDLLSYDTAFIVMNLPACVPGSVNCPIFSRTSGGVFTSEPFTVIDEEFLVLEVDPGAANFGPYWLYRKVVPKPSPIFLILTGSLLFSAPLRTLR